MNLDPEIKRKVEDLQGPREDSPTERAANDERRVSAPGG